LAKTSLPEGIWECAGLQILCVEQHTDLPQGVPIHDGIDAAPQSRTEVTSGHPFRNRKTTSVEVDFEEPQLAVPYPPSDWKLPAEKRVKRVFDGYNALVAGIID
jgi:hypothetical protein